MEKYSFLMSVYAKENPNYLVSSIDSMINQTIKPDEIIIVEDGPLTEDLYKVLDSYGKKIKRIKNDNNLGLALSLNKGLNSCRNNLVARMDSDDISKNDRCEKQLKFFKNNPNVDIVGTWIEEFADSISNIVSIRKVPCEYSDIYNYAKRRSAFNHPTVMYKKDKVLQNGGYSNLRRNQDVDLFGRMLFSGCKAANIGESLLYFRTDNNLFKRRKSWENTKTYINTIKKFWKMGYSSYLDYLIVLFAQTCMFILPTKLQNLVYSYLLRK